MSEIPDDIKAAALKCAETVCRNLDYDDVSIEVDCIARALLAEREAATKAERERAYAAVDFALLDFPADGPDDFGRGHSHAKTGALTAIRSGARP